MKCVQCGSEMELKTEYVTDVLGIRVTDGTGHVQTCPNCGAVDVTLEQAQRYEQRAAATVLAETAKPSGALLRYARRALDLTQVKLSAELGYSAEHVSRMESGAMPIQPAVRLALVALLDAAARGVQYTPREDVPSELRVAS